MKKPLITEKSMKLAKDGLYTFLVASDARKTEILKEVKDKFGVDVLSVKTVNIKEETKMQRGRRGYFVISGVKKALIQVKKGQKIEVFETALTADSEKAPKEAESAIAEKKVVKETKSLLKGTKVKIETSDKKEKQGEK